MAKISLKNMKGATLTEDNSGATYSTGFTIGRAITANITIATKDGKLYADDVPAEAIKEFDSGNISLGVAELEYDIQESLLGHKVVSGTMTANVNDTAPYVGVGFCGQVIRGGTRKWRAIWFYKVIFAEPSDENQTKGESITFHTPTIAGTIMPIKNGDWKTETIVDTEDAAIDWINSMANITK